MKSEVNLESGIFNTSLVRSVGSQVVTTAANEFKKSTGQKMITGPQTGRIYKYKGKTHRASARRERPAKLSGKLIADIIVNKTGETSAEVVSTATNQGFDYPAHLQNNMERLIMTDQDRAEAQLQLDADYERALAQLI